MEFAVLVDPPAEQRARVAALGRAGGRFIEDADAIFWASSELGLIEEDGLVVCGLVDPGRADGDTLLRAALTRYRQAGPDALKDLEDSFSLIAWDHRTRMLTAIRDRFGIQPCYHTTSDPLIFASDMRLLAHLLAGPLAPDMKALSGFIAGFEDDERLTAFQGIARLPKGHLAQWQPGAGLSDAPYATLSLPAQIPMNQVKPRMETALQHATRRSVAHRVDVGCMLSGGLDSSSLAVLAAPEVKSPLKTLSFVYRDSDSYNERPFIDEVNTLIGADPVLLPITGAPPPETLADLAEEQFDLCPAPGLMKSRQIYAAAREQGLSALLDGHGGDEVISHGYVRQAELAAQGAYFALWRELRGAARIYGSPVLENYLGYLFKFAPLRKRGVVRRAIGWLGRRIARPKPAEIDAARLLDPAFRAAQDLEARMAPGEKADGGPDERVNHLENITSPVMSRSFEVLRRTARAQGLEPLYPFFDRNLVETCLSVPPEAKLRNGWSRYALRIAMEGHLPKSIQWRPDKADFSSEVLDFVLTYLDDPARKAEVLGRLEGIVDPDVFEQTHRALQAVERNTASSATLALWRCLYAAEWFKKLEVWAMLQKEGRLWQMQ